MKTKLATLEKGQLMVRHPHFTQPIFVRFPRPAVMRGRDGAERYPQAVGRRPRRGGAAHAAHARSVAHARLGAGRRRHSRRRTRSRARNATLRERPADVRKFFRGAASPARRAAGTGAQPRRRLYRAPADDPYGF